MRTKFTSLPTIHPFQSNLSKCKFKVLITYSHEGLLMMSILKLKGNELDRSTWEDNVPIPSNAGQNIIEVPAHTRSFLQSRRYDINSFIQTKNLQRYLLTALYNDMDIPTPSQVSHINPISPVSSVRGYTIRCIFNPINKGYDVFGD